MKENPEINKKDSFYYAVVIGIIVFGIIMVTFIGMGIHGLLNR